MPGGCINQGVVLRFVWHVHREMTDAMCEFYNHEDRISSHFKFIERTGIVPDNELVSQWRSKRLIANVQVKHWDLILFYFYDYDYYYFWPGCMVCRIIVPKPGIEPMSLALEAWSLNHWTAREVPITGILETRSVNFTLKMSHS